MLKEFTNELVKRGVPPLYAQEEARDPLVYAQIQILLFDWRWFVTEAEVRADDVLFFGLTAGYENELGYFSLEELKRGKSPFLIKWFNKPVPLSVIKQKYNL